MTSFNQHAFAASPSGAVQIQVSCQLMDDYRFSTDLTAQTAINAFRDATGNYRLLYVGAAGNIMTLFPDEASDTGWQEQELNNDFSASQLEGVVFNNQTYAFSLGPNAIAPDLLYSVQTADGWLAWQSVPVGEDVPHAVVVSTLKARVIDSKLYLFVLLTDAPGYSGYGSGIWQLDCLSSQPTWTSLCQTDQSVLEFCTIAPSGLNLLYAVSSPQNPTTVDFYTLASPFTGTPALLASQVSFTALAVAQQADTNSLLVVADNGFGSGINRVQVLSGTTPTAGFQTIDDSLTAMTIVATDEGTNGGPNIFALDYHGRLNLLAATGAGQWAAPLDLSLSFSSLTTIKDAAGASELLGYQPATGLTRLWQSPPAEDEPGTWEQAAITYVVKNQRISEQKTFVTVLTVLDKDEARMPNAMLTVKATDLVTAIIAGESRMLGPQLAATCQTDSAGTIRLTTVAASLSTTQFSVSLPGLLDESDDFPVIPNADIQTRLANISESDVRAIKPDASDPAGVVKAVQNVMGAIAPSGKVSAIRFRTRTGQALDTPFVGVPAMQPMYLRVENGQLIHRFVSSAEAESLLNSVGGGVQLLAFGIFDVFENIVDAIADAAKAAADFVVEKIIMPVKDGIQTAITFIIDGVKHVYQGVIKTLEKAFQLVEVVFNAIKAVFQQLYDFFAWLLTKARKDIWATKTKFENYLTTGVSQLATLALTGAASSSAFFKSTAATVANSFDKVEQQLTGFTAGTAYKASLPGIVTGAGGAESIISLVNGSMSASNWLSDKLLGSALGVLSFDISIAQKIIDDLNNMLAKLVGQVSAAVEASINNFMQHLVQIASSMTSLEDATLAAVIDGIKEAVLLVLSIASDVASDILTLLGNTLVGIMDAVLNAKITNWLVRGIYNLINPGASEDVTVGRLVCLMCAFPVTVVHQLLFNSSPYPSTSSAPTSVNNPLYRYYGQAQPLTREAENPDLVCSGLLYIFPWAVLDVATDIGKAADAVGVWNVLMFIVPLTIEVLAWPGGVGAAPDLSTPLGKAQFAAWSVGFGSSIVRLMYMVRSNFATGPRKTLDGCLLLSGMGMASMATNVVVFIELFKAKKATAYNVIPLWLGPISPIAKPLKFFKSPHAIVGLGIVDAISDVGTGVCRIITGREG